MLIYIIKLFILDNEVPTLERIIPVANQRQDRTFECLLTDDEYILTDIEGNNLIS